MRKILIAAAAILFLANNIFAGQTITIDTANPSLDAVVDTGGDPDDNTLNIEAHINSAHVVEIDDGITSASGNTANVSARVNNEVHAAHIVSSSDGTFEVAGAADGNSINISAGAQIDGDVAGGYIAAIADGAPADITISGSAINNIITMTGGQAGSHIMGGVIAVQAAGGGTVDNFDITGSVENNQVNISSGTVLDEIRGGMIDINNFEGTGGAYNISGDISNNEVNITGGVVKELKGGSLNMRDLIGTGTFDISGNVSDNTVSISGGNISLSASQGLIGGLIEVRYSGETGQDITISGNADDNTVSVSGGLVNGGMIIGGVVYTEDAGGIGGTQTITGGAHNNTVNISGGVLNNTALFGGFVRGGAGTAAGNEINISGTPSFYGNILLYGGFTTDGGDAFTGNTLNMSASGLTIYGLGNFENYNFDLSSANAGDTIFTVLNGDGRGHNVFDIVGAAGTNGAIDIDGATIGLMAGGHPTSLNLGDRIILISEEGGNGFTGTLANEYLSAVDGDITYGYKAIITTSTLDLFQYSIATTGDWTQNMTLTAGANVGEDVYLNVSGDIDGANLTATSNANSKAYITSAGLIAGEDTVITLNNTAAADINFGDITIGDGNSLVFAGNGLYTGTVVEQGINTAFIYQSPGDVFADINGNATAGLLDLSSQTGDITLHLNGSAPDDSVLFNTIEIGGGVNLTIEYNDATYDFNTLNSRGTDSTINGDLLAANKNLNFYLPGTMNAGETMLTVDGTADITNSTVKVGIAGPITPLQAGDKVVLIQANEITGAAASMKNVGMTQGVTIQYKFNLSFGTEIAGGMMALNAELSTPTQLFATILGSSATPESKALSEGRAASVAFVNQGTELLSDRTLLTAVSDGHMAGGTSVFYSATSGKSRYESGSYADVKGVSMLGGVAKDYIFDENILTAGLFIEYGTGNYNTNNSIPGGTVEGKGNTRYAGGGLAGHFGFSNDVYVGGSLRVGQVKTDFSGVLDSLQTSYDYDTIYYGIHLSGGRIFEMGEKTMLDAYGKYLWTRQNGKHVDLSTGDDIDFEVSDSARLRAGAKLMHSMSDVVAPYLGLAYDYEFNGVIKASAAGNPVAQPSLKGGTALAELGVRLVHNYLSVDIGAEGYAGTRKGFGGTLKVNYKF